MAITEQWSAHAEQLAKFGSLYYLTAEYNLFVKQCLPGVYCIPSASDPYKWTGVIFVRNGFYRGGIFRFEVAIPKEFPLCDRPPEFRFKTPVFHRAVHPETYAIDDSLFSPWRNQTRRIFHVIEYALHLFYEPLQSSILNPEGVNLYDNAPEEYLDKVRECVQASRKSVYDPVDSTDSHAIRFSAFKPEIHQSYLDAIFKTDTSPKESR